MEAARLARFRGPVEARDAEAVERWRQATPTEHSRALWELLRLADLTMQATGRTKPAEIEFPGFQAVIQGQHVDTRTTS